MILVGEATTGPHDKGVPWLPSDGGVVVSVEVLVSEDLILSEGLVKSVGAGLELSGYDVVSCGIVVSPDVVLDNSVVIISGKLVDLVVVSESLDLSLRFGDAEVSGLHFVSTLPSLDSVIVREALRATVFATSRRFVNWT